MPSAPCSWRGPLDSSPAWWWWGGGRLGGCGGVGVVARGGDGGDCGGGDGGSSAQLLPQSCPPVGEPDLNPCLTHPCLLSQVLPGVNIWVLGSLEGLLQQLKLVVVEGGPGPPGLPLDLQARLGVDV